MVAPRRKDGYHRHMYVRGVQIVVVRSPADAAGAELAVSEKDAEKRSGVPPDEHGIRAKERYFSPRDDQFQWNYENQPAEIWDQYKSFLYAEEHFRVHPILHFTELDIWKYIKREDLPIVPLYFSNEGKRFRSIGCVPCCSPVDSSAASIDEIIEEIRTSKHSERAGRAQDKENIYTMQKLRALGYM